MKRIILTVLGVIVICFLLPVLFRAKIKTTVIEPQLENSQIEQVQTNDNNTYNYEDYNKIKLLHKNSGNIEELNLDEYLYGVVSAEIPANYKVEALKAQAVVARTYTIYKIKNSPNKHKGASICDDSTCCQAWITKEDRLEKWEENKREEYWNKIMNAVKDTRGKVITYDGKVINAFFHANSGGTTEMPINVWGGSGYPYLQVVETAGEDAYKQYKSEVIISFEDLEKKIKEKHDNIKIDFSKKDAIQITEFTDSGRVKTIKFGNVELSGVETRQLFKLRSANFRIEVKEDKVKFDVVGYGHGVGMSQTGADALAKERKNI